MQLTPDLDKDALQLDATIFRKHLRLAAAILRAEDAQREEIMPAPTIFLLAHLRLMLHLKAKKSQWKQGLLETKVFQKDLRLTAPNLTVEETQ